MIFESNKVRVFPSMNRSYMPSSKLTSEANFVNIIHSILDKDSYFLEYNNNILRVVIHGYYFEIETLTKPSTLYIMVENSSGCLVNLNTGSPVDMDSSGNCNFISDTNPTAIGGCTVYPLDTSKQARISTDSIYVDSDTDLTTQLSNIGSTKQDNISVTSDLSFNANVVGIATAQKNKLDGLNGKGSNTNPVYFNNNGIATASNANIGSGWDSTNKKTQMMYMSSGSFTNGITIYAGTSSPDNNTGNNGDIYFKYSE